MKKIFLITVTIFLLNAATSTAQQDYRLAAGLNIRQWSYGGTIKYFLNEKSAIEGLINYKWRGVNVTEMYQYHGKFQKKKLRHLRRLNWYMGGGAHIGYFGKNNPFFQKADGFTIIGADGIIGLEYKITAAPLSFGVDYKPAVNIIALPDPSGLHPDSPGGKRLWQDEIGLSVRYIFIGY